MTDDDLLATARACIAKWQARLHLGEWRMVVGLAERPSEHFEAAINHQWREYRAYLEIRADYPAWKRAHGVAGPAYADESDAQLIEAVVLHELVHLTQQPFGNQFDHEFKEWVGSDGALTSDLRSHWVDYVEALTERTVRVLLEADRGAWAGGG